MFKNSMDDAQTNLDDDLGNNFLVLYILSRESLPLVPSALKLYRKTVTVPYNCCSSFDRISSGMNECQYVLLEICLSWVFDCTKFSRFLLINVLSEALLKNLNLWLGFAGTAWSEQR